MLSGLRIAALYGIKPHQLGLCGPQKAAKNGLLKDFLLGQAPANIAEEALKQFRGAYPYCALIAKCNDIKNPFEEKVVRAYWIGNDLLESVALEDFRNMVRVDFNGQGLLDKKTAEQKARQIPDGAKPHHSFHVLFMGSVTGTVNFDSTAIKDLCRVGWGKIEGHKNGKIVVRTQPLVDKKKIKLGPPIQKELNWAKKLLPQAKTGAWVSFHWGQAVEILSVRQVTDLKKYTQQTLTLLS